MAADLAIRCLNGAFLRQFVYAPGRHLNYRSSSGILRSSFSLPPSGGGCREAPRPYDQWPRGAFCGTITWKLARPACDNLRQGTLLCAHARRARINLACCPRQPMVRRPTAFPTTPPEFCMPYLKVGLEQVSDSVRLNCVAFQALHTATLGHPHDAYARR